MIISAVPPESKSGEAPGDQPLRVYVGTYTGGKSQGIYLLELDPATSVLTPKGLAGESVNPSFLAIHPTHRFLYAVAEVNDVNGKKGGGVSAFTINQADGTLTALNGESTQGAGPCYVTVDREGKNALAANYSGGSAAVLPIQADGKVSPASAFVQHEGKGADPKRQDKPHVHSINLDAANRFAFVADLGLDKVFVYRFDPKAGTLTPNDPPFAKVAPGSGPRHFAFHPDGRHAYLINEMKSTVTVFNYDPEQGVLTETQTISTLPEGFDGVSWTAEVQVHPSGKFLYGSNRGHDSIAVFAIDPQSGKLSTVAHEPTLGKNPRHFGIDPSGRTLLAANQDSDNIVVFRINPETGRLQPTGQQVEIPKPVCVKMIPINK
ncbi:MAG: lactonase family protein [Isosphaeraceae bacterium]